MEKMSHQNKKRLLRMFYEYSKHRPKPTEFVSKEEELVLPASIGKVKRKPNQRKGPNSETTGKRPESTKERKRGMGRGRGAKKEVEEDPLNFQMNSPVEDSDSSDFADDKKQTHKRQPPKQIKKSLSEETDVEEKFLKRPRSTKSRDVKLPSRFEETPESVKKKKSSKESKGTKLSFDAKEKDLLNESFGSAEELIKKVNLRDGCKTGAYVGDHTNH